MNKLAKLLVLIIYTGILFSISFLIISLSSKNRQFDEYTTKPYNEDLIVNVQVVENRQSKTQTGTDYEYSKYDMYLSLYKLQVAEISNLYVYIGVKGENNKLRYTEISSAKTMGNGTYQTGAISLLNSSTSFAYNKIEVEHDHDHERDNVVVKNYIPKNVFVKIAYDIVYSDSQEKHYKELNYKFDYEAADVNKFDTYKEVKADNNSYFGNYDPENNKSAFKFKLSKSISDSSESISFFSYTINKDVLEGASIENSKVLIYGLIENTSMVNEKYFSKYIRLFSCYGSKHLERNVSSTRKSTYDTNYEIKKLFVEAEFKLSSGKVLKYNYYINVNDLE